VATASGNRPEDTPDAVEHATRPEDSRPERPGEAGLGAPVSGDVEIAEAQLALGRPEYAEPAAAGAPGDDEAPEEPDDEELVEDEPPDEAPGGPGGGGDYDEDDDLGPEDGGSGGGRRAPSTAVSAPRERSGSRLVHFLQGSWRELQRVQWPDRRQVMQATGVVIGFVIVAGVFLGVADFLATKIVKLILP
jgi:preprotein translocase subunit SecE